MWTRTPFHPPSATTTTSLEKTGSGEWTLASANTFTGPTPIAGGTLRLGNSLALQNSTLSYNFLGSRLSFDTLSAATIGALEGFQDLPLENIFAGSVALTVGGKNVSTIYFGILSGPGSIIKTGTGVFTLAAGNSYTSGTTINGGAINVLATDGLGLGGTITVNTAGGLRIGNGVTLGNNIVGNTGANELLDVPDAGAAATLIARASQRQVAKISTCITSTPTSPASSSSMAAASPSAASLNSTLSPGANPSSI